MYGRPLFQFQIKTLSSLARLRLLSVLIVLLRRLNPRRLDFIPDLKLELFAAAGLMFLLAHLFTGSAEAATVKPLEVFSEKILVLEIEYLATEHTLASVLLRKSVDSLNKGMNIMSRETARDSLKLLTNVSESLSAAKKSSAALSGYLSANSSRLKKAGHGRFLPLAEMDPEIETPYYKALEVFIKTAFSFVHYCSDNFEAISSGSKEEGKRDEELYASYLREMELFNLQSINRSQFLAEMGSEYPSLWELMPR